MGFHPCPFIRHSFMGSEQGSAGLCREICTNMWGFSAFFWGSSGRYLHVAGRADPPRPVPHQIFPVLVHPSPAPVGQHSLDTLTTNQLLLLFLVTTSVSVFSFLLPSLLSPPQHTWIKALMYSNKGNAPTFPLPATAQ